mgnify:CR=1 FL=1
MTLQHEIKGNLARLLATENLIVEHSPTCRTASFDVQKRVLQLPQWDFASNTVYDLLVGHEVGHALYTPNYDWTQDADCPKDYINVIEDVRIERLMKRKYPGLIKTFARGYKELDSRDFFEIGDEDLKSFILIDRINLNAKVGATAMIPFTAEEMVFVVRAEAAETFEEVIEIAKDVYAYQKQMEENAQKENLPNNSSKEGTGELELQQTEPSPEHEDIESSSSDGSGNDDEEEEDEDGDDCTQGSNRGGDHNSDEARTQKAFDEQTKQLNRNDYNSRTISYAELPENLDIDSVVVDWSEVHDWIDSNRKEFISTADNLKKFVKDNVPEHNGNVESFVYSTPDAEYRKFRKQSQKEVNYLVKEFECRKSASAYARAATSRTGVLDTARLHTYKYNEDLFKKITVLPDGKNHGLIFVLDWSGSMNTTIYSTVKQLLNLTAFCKKVQIPFEVYAFTNEWRIVNRIKSNTNSSDPYFGYRASNEEVEPVVGEIYVDSNNFNMVNLISSRSNSRNYERQCVNVWREAWLYQGHRNSFYRPTTGLELSGTPLNEAMVCLNYILPTFKKQNDLEKVNVCVLTDGEGSMIGVGKKTYSYDGEDSKVSQVRMGYDHALRDRKTGRVYAQFTDGYTDVTTTLINQVKDRNPGVNVVGFRILPGTHLQSFVNRYSTTDYYDIQKQWRKDKAVVIPNPTGFSELYALQDKALDTDAEFAVESGAAKGQISKAFKKMLGSKSNNKKILSSFIGMVS